MCSQVCYALDVSDEIPKAFIQPPAEADEESRLEGRLEREARKNGLTLVQSKGTYMLLKGDDIEYCDAELGAYGLTLPDVEKYLAGL